MKENKTRHFEPFSRGLFTHMFPQGKNGWGNKSGAKIDAECVKKPENRENPERIKTQSPNQKSLDKIWDWLWNPDEY